MMVNIKEIRNLTGLSQTAFANKFGIPLRTYQSWELGERKPPEYVLTMIIRLIDQEEQIKELKGKIET